MATGRMSRPTGLVRDDEPVPRMPARATLAPGGSTLARNGSGVLREPRRDPAGATTPVIVPSARAQAAGREARGLAGATRHLTRPFGPVGLAALLEEVLEP
jgi:CheY-like chemotaxis protein